jgi:hypothetical protein
MDRVVSLPNRDELRHFVKETLCRYDQLDAEQTPFYEAIVTRMGRPCGLFFEVEGPRLVRTHAIWAGDEHRLYFFNSMGDRFADMMLSEEPDPTRLDEPQFRLRIA